MCPDFEIKSKIYSFNLRLVLKHILHSQDVFFGDLSRKKCVTFLRGGGGGSPQKRPYDVSRGQNRYVICYASLMYVVL